MNIGVYIANFSNEEQMKGIADHFNDAIISKKVTDASLFYDDISHNPMNLNFGLFNSTDLWNFNGSLVVTNLNSLVNAINIVNKIDLYYYYGWEENIKPLNILFGISKGVKIICRNDTQQKYMQRITGQEPIGVSNNFENIVDLLRGTKNG